MRVRSLCCFVLLAAACSAPAASSAGSSAAPRLADRSGPATLADPSPRDEPLAAGSQAPALALGDFELASALDKGPVVLVFYRGHW